MAGGNSKERFTTFGSSSTNRPTPIVAAFGIFIRRGTSTVIGPLIGHWHDSRQPSSSLSGRWR